jgi:diguanylate cyclase (GGDEF)-like protein
MASLLPRRLLGTRATLLLVPAIAFGGTIGSEQLRERADRAASARIAVEHLRADANEQDAARWHALAQPSLRKRLTRDIAANFVHMRAELAGAEARSDTEESGVDEALAAYGEVVVQELRAGEPDDPRVDAAFSALHDELVAAEERSARRADVSRAASVRATWLIVSAGTLLVLLLFWSFFRTRQRSLAALLREEALQREIREREHEANHDALTGLPNRRSLMRRLEEALAVCARDGTTGALLLLDLDGFKDVNDALGHAAGDALLGELGPRLQPILREGDVLARLGGDELALLMRPGAHLDAPAVERVAREAGAAIARPFVLDEGAVRIEASVGIALFPEHGRDAADVLRRADAAMYQAKRSRSGHALYEASATA